LLCSDCQARLRGIFHQGWIMTKIGYVTIGAKDSDASVKFYDAVFKALGDERKFFEGGWAGYGPPSEDKGFASCHTMLCKPQNGQEARGGNGIMISYKAPNQDAVTAAYNGGLANGGSDEGKPGFRPPDATSGFFGAYLRDPTGNKICVFHY
jgi:catechol 2,3-dioxygenase-like lactoylglutathione lyase family enzyme